MKTVCKIIPQKVQNKTCSAIAGMCIVNNDIYVLASKSGDGVTKQPCVLHKYFNYLDTDNGVYDYSVIRTAKGSKSIAVHANSITYSNHLFYIVTRNGRNENQIMVLTSDGIIQKKYKYTKSMIATINHFEVNKFLISVNGGLSIKYRLVEIGDTIKDLGIEFRCLIPDVDYGTGNDSYYDKKDKRLYITKFKNKTENKIFVYDLKNIVNGKNYNSEKEIYVKSEEKFEVEGIGLYNKIVGCVNATEDGKQADKVVII